MYKSELTEFLAELTEFAAELSEFSLPQQYSRNSIPPVSFTMEPKKNTHTHIFIVWELIPICTLTRKDHIHIILFSELISRRITLQLHKTISLELICR